MRISRLVWEWLAAGAYTGRLLSQHDHSLNLIDENGRVLTLSRPPLPLGPFAIDLPARAPWPEADGPIRLSLDPAHSAIDLARAEIWEPVVNWPALEVWTDAVWPLLAPYAVWSALNEQPKVLADQLRRRAALLQQAWRMGDGLAEAGLGLIGLGNGLTPAGDDYLIGFFAATKTSHSHLYQTKPKPQLNQPSAKTTSLSAAFLQAAESGAFSEQWHGLAAALASGNTTRLRLALTQIAGQGATSGQDALAGFAQTLSYVAKNC